MFVSYHLSTRRATICGPQKEILYPSYGMKLEDTKFALLRLSAIINEFTDYVQGANNKGGGKWRGISPVQSACQIAVHFKMPRALSEPLAPLP